MDSSQNQTNILAISTDKLILKFVKNEFKSQKGYKLIDMPVNNENIIENISLIQPDCIILDYAYDNIDLLKLIDSISIQFPKIAVIVILGENKISESNNVILAGARAFLIKPLKKKSLFETLSRVMELQGRSKSTSIKIENSDLKDNIPSSIVVFSPKGGSGVSSLSINLGLAFMENLKNEILLVDGKLLFGHLDLMLNLYSQNSINDLIAHVGLLDEILINDVVSTHTSGIKLLSAPKSILSGQGIKPDDIYELLIKLQNVFDFIIIDGGNYLNENVVTYMDLSTIIVLVINPDITSLRDASQFFEVCRTLNYPKEKIQVIINKFDKKEGLSLDEIEKALKTKILGSIPLESKSSRKSINRGIPILFGNKKTQLAKAYKKIAKTLNSIIEENSKSNNYQLPSSEALNKSSKLG